MQSNQFNNLMNGEEAKWLESLNPEKLDMESDTPINEQIEVAIEEGQVTIPEDTQEEIRAFIKMLKGLKVKEGEIRRRVKIRFNIHVV